MKILIVEDYLHTRKTTAYALKTKIPDVMITEADNGLEAINRKFSFTEESVTLSDSFTYSGNGKITERLVTLFVPEI